MTTISENGVKIDTKRGMTMSGFVYPQLHNEYSLFGGSSKIKKGRRWVTITCYDTMFGVAGFFMSIHEAGIKFIDVLEELHLSNRGLVCLKDSKPAELVPLIVRDKA